MIATNVTPAPVKTSWSDLKVKLKSKFTILTDADLNFEESKKEDMLAVIQKKIGKNREELTAIISSL